MRVLLIAPTFNYKKVYPVFLSITDFPTGLAYLAAALKNAGHEVFGLYPNNAPEYPSAYEMVLDKITQSLSTVKPDLIGLGGLCTDFLFLKHAIKIIREKLPHVPIVCGGGIVTHDAEFIFSALRPDFCIIGEGEETLVNLANVLENGRKDYESITNLGYWHNGSVKFTRRNLEYGNLDNRAFPDYEPFGVYDLMDNFPMAARNLFRYSRLNPRPMVIVTARGCPFSCTFCVHGHDSKYRSRSIENILQEIKFLYENYHFNVLLILDELFAVNKSRMNEFSLQLIEARRQHRWDFDWMFQTHASASLDRESLELAKRAGCYFFSYGLESASPRVLASMNKKTKPQAIEQAIAKANSVGIGFGGNFIFGDEAETEESIFETMNFFYRHCLDLYISLDTIDPYPGSKLFNRCLERGIIRSKAIFYKKIEELDYNMTVLPDRLWSTWVRLLNFFSSTSPWLKSTYALAYEEDLGARSNPIVQYSLRSIFIISAKCPFCGTFIRCKEFVKKPPQRSNGDDLHHKKKSYALFVFNHLILGNLRKIKEVFKLFTLIRPDYFVFKKPLLQSLKGIKDDKENEMFVVTGCPHCNKVIKIVIPGYPRNSAMLFIRKLLSHCL